MRLFWILFLPLLDSTWARELPVDNTSTSHWSLEHHKDPSLSIRKLPVDIPGRPPHLALISSELCKLRDSLGISLICCPILKVKVEEEKFRYLNRTESYAIWSSQPSVVGEDCQLWGNISATDEALTNLTLCQFLHCYPTRRLSKLCRRGCIDCGSPCRQQYYLFFPLGL